MQRAQTTPWTENDCSVPPDRAGKVTGELIKLREGVLSGEDLTVPASTEVAAKTSQALDLSRS